MVKDGTFNSPGLLGGISSGFFVLCYIKLRVLFTAKLILEKDLYSHNLTITGLNKMVQTFPIVVK